MAVYNFQLRELEIVRLCLKHFRQQGYEEAFTALQLQTNVNLEHPVMSELHRTLVVDGDFERVEQFVDQFVNEGLLDDYLSVQDYKAVWAQQSIDDGATRPGMRGGHQLIVDSSTGLMYLFGGWDGFEDLSDMWQYDIRSNVWSLIHDKAEKYGGPGPRSCHKMLFDSTNSQIFALGRYLDGSSRKKENLNVRDRNINLNLELNPCFPFRVISICSTRRHASGCRFATTPATSVVPN